MFRSIFSRNLLIRSKSTSLAVVASRRRVLAPQTTCRCVGNISVRKFEPMSTTNKQKRTPEQQYLFTQTSRIRNSNDSCLYEASIQLYRETKSKIEVTSIPPDRPFLYFSAFAARKARNFDAAKDIYNYAIENGIIYEKVFEQVQRAYFEVGKPQQALDMFLEIVKHGSTITEFILSTSLLSLLQLKRFDELLDLLQSCEKNFNVKPTIALYSIVCRGLCEAQAHSQVLSLLPTIVAPVHGTKQPRVAYTRAILAAIEESGINPDKFLLRSMLSASTQIFDPDLVNKLALIIRNSPGALDDVATITALTLHYSRSHSPDSADQLIMRAYDRNLRLDAKFYRVALAHEARYGRFEQMFAKLDEMIASGILPDQVTFVMILTEINQKSHEENINVHFQRVRRYIDKTRTPVNPHLTSALVYYYLQRQEFAEATKARDLLTAKTGSVDFVVQSIFCVQYAILHRWTELRDALELLDTAEIPTTGLRFWFGRRVLFECRAANKEDMFDLTRSFLTKWGAPEFDVPLDPVKAKASIGTLVDRISSTIDFENSETEMFEIMS